MLWCCSAAFVLLQAGATAGLAVSVAAARPRLRQMDEWLREVGELLDEADEQRDEWRRHLAARDDIMTRIETERRAHEEITQRSARCEKRLSSLLSER